MLETNEMKDNIKGLNHYVSKGWGYEYWIWNNEEYCGKKLFMLGGKKLSWHYHNLKDETFYIQSGEVRLFYGDDADINKANQTVLKQGHTFHIYRGLKHRLEAIVDSEIFEFSTTHKDEDSIRIEKGD